MNQSFKSQQLCKIIVVSLQQFSDAHQDGYGQVQISNYWMTMEKFVAD